MSLLSADVKPPESAATATADAATADAAREPFRKIKSFVLRGGRSTAAQKRSYNSLSGKFIIPYDAKTADFAGVFGNGNPVIVEIGFGMGAATAVIAGENPQKNYIGIEIHKPGIGRLLWEIERRPLLNVRIIEHDAADVFENMIPANSLEGVHVFFPDPWPKKRHHKRRLIQGPFTDCIASKLKPGGYIYMATDWLDYADWALSVLTNTGGMVNEYDGFAPPQSWRPLTSFEKKGLDKKHEIKELFFRRGT
ncbi:MAG: tRNA (guanosine(46)-N7)-methyltransferase TrmB [Treponema sp.]|jgi:tRNA (guanine-N7-)-methyltransferase|nr:tRNA (guanosine(46)-N7)-methyltransferase TrmB [Treponema sp.]